MGEKAETTVNITEPEDNSKPAFFPWLEAGEKPQRAVTKLAQRFPIGSALTILLSFTVLWCFREHTVIPQESYFPKPAAWLSIIGSLNSILLHIAVSQGLNISWWFRASRTETTVAELHNNGLLATVSYLQS
jgi:Protein of unknown function (DUF3176)